MLLAQSTAAWSSSTPPRENEPRNTAATAARKPTTVAAHHGPLGPGVVQLPRVGLRTKRTVKGSTSIEVEDLRGAGTQTSIMRREGGRPGGRTRPEPGPDAREPSHEDIGKTVVLAARRRWKYR
ncbi:hypothetical protein EYF80_059959 [Liparis tanakae]|uniref:Uncharacterized protein n=1 Tax=Liparis tanakae TaxID=230148 RepID=A0A4Z2EMT4_9TELE|nr:hypothetical protein EYF80_059959 [Liparis tanakae]